MRPGTLKLLAIGFLLAAGPVAFLHNYLYHSGLDSEFVVGLHAFHEGIIEGQGYAPFQYRLLAYWLPEWLSRMGLPLHFAYTANRYVWTCATLVALYVLLRQWFESLLALTGCLIYLALLPLTYFSGHLQPADAPLFLLTLLGYLALQQGRYWALPVVMVLGGLFHETIAWLIPLTALLFWMQRPLTVKRILLVAALGALWLATYVGVRYLVGPRPLLSERVQWSHNLSLAWSYINTAIMLSPLLLLGKRLWSQAPDLARSGLLLIPAQVVIIWVFARPSEARLFLPTLPFSLIVGLLWLRQNLLAPPTSERGAA